MHSQVHTLHAVVRAHDSDGNPWVACAAAHDHGDEIFWSAELSKGSVVTSASGLIRGASGGRLQSAELLQLALRNAIRSAPSR